MIFFVARRLRELPPEVRVTRKSPLRIVQRLSTNLSHVIHTHQAGAVASFRLIHHCIRNFD